MFADFIPSVPASQLPPGEVHLWLIDTRDCLEKDRLFQGSGLLSEDEKRRWRQFRRAEKQHQFLAGRVALRCILAALLNQTSPREITFTTNAYGKPALCNTREHLQFNLSHSGNLVLIAVARDRACGVDIQQMKNTRKADELARFYFHPAEYSTMKPQEDKATNLRQFYKLWVLKEAFIKAEGKGMAIPGDGFCFCDIESDNPRVSVTHPTVASGQPWWFHHQFYADSFSMALALATHTESVPITLQRRRFDFSACLS